MFHILEFSDKGYTTTLTKLKDEKENILSMGEKIGCVSRER
jgi:hypothetical protein